jgi:hypothetical protein
MKYLSVLTVLLLSFLWICANRWAPFITIYYLFLRPLAVYYSLNPWWLFYHFLAPWRISLSHTLYLLLPRPLVVRLSLTCSLYLLLIRPSAVLYLLTQRSIIFYPAVKVTLLRSEVTLQLTVGQSVSMS